MAKAIPLEQRFWAKVRKSDDCWEWTGAKDRGYGLIGVHRNGIKLAHRISWKLHNGEMPPPEILVCHKCDNPSCVRPDHLFLGTQADNMQDMINKGRSRSGCNLSPKSFLTEENIIEIRATPGRTNAMLARKFGCTAPAIWQIKHRKTWKHV